jgi:hypothetical protein
MANRGYDVVVDVDAEVITSIPLLSLAVPSNLRNRATSAILTFRRTLNSTLRVSTATDIAA